MLNKRITFITVIAILFLSTACASLTGDDEKTLWVLPLKENKISLKRIWV